jgi:hypothetical protein
VEIPIFGETCLRTLKMCPEKALLLFLWCCFLSFVAAGAAPSARASRAGFFSVDVSDVGVFADGVLRRYNEAGKSE